MYGKSSSTSLKIINIKHLDFHSVTIQQTITIILRSFYTVDNEKPYNRLVHSTNKTQVSNKKKINPRRQPHKRLHSPRNIVLGEANASSREFNKAKRENLGKPRVETKQFSFRWQVAVRKRCVPEIITRREESMHNDLASQPQ